VATRPVGDLHEQPKQAAQKSKRVYVAKNKKKEEEKARSSGSSGFVDVDYNDQEDSDYDSSSDNDSSDVDLEDVCFVEAMLNHAEVEFDVGGEDSEESENEQTHQIMTTGDPISLKKDV